MGVEGLWKMTIGLLSGLLFQQLFVLQVCLSSCKSGRQGSARFFKVGFFELFCALVNISRVWTSFCSFSINSDSSPKNKYGKSLSIILEGSCIYIYIYFENMISSSEKLTIQWKIFTIHTHQVVTT